MVDGAHAFNTKFKKSNSSTTCASTLNIVDGAHTCNTNSNICHSLTTFFLSNLNIVGGSATLHTTFSNSGNQTTTISQLAVFMTPY